LINPLRATIPQSLVFSQSRLAEKSDLEVIKNAMLGSSIAATIHHLFSVQTWFLEANFVAEFDRTQ
jgi:hypothetical protein